MRLVGAALRAIAVVMILMGLLWIGQGTGLVHWPASSFMLDQRSWAVRGAILAVVGIACWVVGRRISARAR